MNKEQNRIDREFIRYERKEDLHIKEMENISHKELLCFKYELSLDKLLSFISLCNDIEFMKKLIDSGLNVNERLSYGNRPLFYACAEKSYDIVKFLIECGADVNHKNVFGGTALNIASSMLSWEAKLSPANKIFDLLRKNGAHE